MNFESKRKGWSKDMVKQYFIDFNSKRDIYLAKAHEILDLKEFTFSIEEIDKLAVIYKKFYKSPKIIGLDYDELLDIFITYCGVAWIHHFGGEWFDTVSSRDVAYGFPQIINWGPKDYGWIGISPHDWAFLIEEGDDDPLSSPYRRKINYFKNSEEYNFKSKI